MNILDPNELGLTVVDQAHTIRVQNTRISELEGQLAFLSAELQRAQQHEDAADVAAGIIAEAAAKPSRRVPATGDA